MENVEEQCVDITPFLFRITAEDLETYRRALGVAGERVPFGMALRAVSSETVLSALREMVGSRHPIHISQECRAERPLQIAVDYVCDIRLVAVSADRLRIQQRLSDSHGEVCVTLSSDIALVSA